MIPPSRKNVDAFLRGFGVRFALVIRPEQLNPT
jgi:hypothetical protein